MFFLSLFYFCFLSQQKKLSKKKNKIQTNIKELPHHRIMRNIKRFFAEVGDNKELKDRIMEDMVFALPTASKQS